MWLTTKYGADQRIAPMKVRQDQLGLDGAIEYRKLIEAHPDVLRGPDEEIYHHLDRLRANERVEPRLAASDRKRKTHNKPVAEGMPARNIIQNELGSDTGHYIRLFNDFSDDFPRGPDESISDHYRRLKDAKSEWSNESKRPESQPDHFTRPVDLITPDWLKQREQPTAPQVSSPRSDLPSRDPGWYVSPETQSRGYGPPPLPRRNPDASRPAYTPGHGPEPQSMNDWLKFLGDKGIFLDADGRRLQPRQPAPSRPIGHDIWSDLIDSPRPETEDESTHAVLKDDFGDFPEHSLGKSWRQRAKDLFRGRSSSVVDEYIKDKVSMMDGDS